MVSYQTVKKYVLRALLLLVALVIGAYIADYSIVRYQASRGGSESPFGTVTVFLATPTKNGQVELFYRNPQSVACVRSLFPHFGYAPCWYAGRSRFKIV